jgi:hypothetical protein
MANEEDSPSAQYVANYFYGMDFHCSPVSILPTTMEDSAPSLSCRLPHPEGPIALGSTFYQPEIGFISLVEAALGIDIFAYSIPTTNLLAVGMYSAALSREDYAAAYYNSNQWDMEVLPSPPRPVQVTSQEAPPVSEAEAEAEADIIYTNAVAADASPAVTVAVGLDAALVPGVPAQLQRANFCSQCLSVHFDIATVAADEGPSEPPPSSSAAAATRLASGFKRVRADTPHPDAPSTRVIIKTEP